MRILVGVDDSSASRVACDFVCSRAWPAGTRVGLLAAIEPVVDLTGLAAAARADRIESARASASITLDDRADQLRRCGLTTDTVVESGDPAELLMSEAAETFADLIIVGSRGRGPAASAVLGSVSTHLADHAGCPVLVVRSPTASRMLLATDGTASSQSIPRILDAWGNAFRGLPVEVLSVASHEGFVTPWAVIDEEPAELMLHEGIAEQVADELMDLGWHAAAIARAGDPSRLIVDAGREWGADLIVTGSRGLSTLRRLVQGSVAHDVLLHTHASVLVMRGHVPARLRQSAPAAALPVT